MTQQIPELALSVLIFILLAGSALFMLAVHPRLPEHYRHDETNNVVRLIANIFVVPMPLIAMLVAWLLLIFASFGYRAPRNLVVISSFVVAAGLISASIYLILDMDVPFSGPVQVTNAPLQRALAEMQSE